MVNVVNERITPSRFKKRVPCGFDMGCFWSPCENEFGGMGYASCRAGFCAGNLVVRLRCCLAQV